MGGHHQLRPFYQGLQGHCSCTHRPPDWDLRMDSFYQWGVASEECWDSGNVCNEDGNAIGADFVNVRKVRLQQYFVSIVS